MKKITKAIVLAALCLNFTAEAQDNKLIDVTAKGIQIGQQVPNITITGLHNYKDKDGKPAIAAKLSDFKGKLLILDFWATWCSPCVAMIPKMDSLQKAFAGKVQFLSITYQREKEVLAFLNKYEKQRKKHYGLPIVTDEKELHRLFPHVYLPHYVWIDGEGIVKAITEYREVNLSTIEKILQGIANPEQKKDNKIAYDKNKPFLIDNNGGNASSLIYHSVFTKYIEGLSSGYNFTQNLPGKSRKITATNMTIVQLYRLAFGGDKLYLGVNKVLLNLKDTSEVRTKRTKGMDFRNWLNEDHGFCYELVVPASNSTNAFRIMQEDLSKFFPHYIAKVEQKKVKCLVLKRTSQRDKLKSAGGEVLDDFSGLGCKMRNSTLDAFIMRLDAYYLQRSPNPIVNGTGYAGRIDMDIDGDFTNLQILNQQLAKYDLEFVAENWVTSMLIVEDNHRLIGSF